MKLVIVTAITGLIGTGCATTNITKTSQAAPITYKIGQGEAQYASLPRSTTPSRPRLTNPDTSAPRGSQGKSFDPSKVDRQLYSHQKLGKTYTVMGKTYTPRHNPDYNKVGEASWYGPGFHGKPTASGEIFNKNALTAAHKTLPLNSMLIVTNMENGKTITVRLIDRGPFIGNRILDLSEAAATKLGYINQGTTRVRVRYAGPADPMASGRTFVPSAPRVAELPQENLTPAPAPIPFTPAPQLPAPSVPQFAEPTLPDPITPSAPRRTPDADLPEGGDITLTIKGPIHMAGSRDTERGAQFIRERLELK